MELDPKYLRQHYASLSDEALLEVNRSELVEAAQGILDDEVKRRELVPVKTARQVRTSDLTGGEIPDAEWPDAGDKPAWFEEAAEVYGHDVRVGSTPAQDAENARDALVTAGIPCHLELCKIPKGQDFGPAPTHYWRLLVPGKLGMHATSVLEREIFNLEFEENWKTHLQALSNEELRALDPQAAFCGLFDRIERVKRAYDEEIRRRSELERSR